MVKPEKLDAATTLKGLDYVEVPAMSAVDFKLNFYAYREGTYSAKVRNSPSLYIFHSLPEFPFGCENNFVCLDCVCE